MGHAVVRGAPAVVLEALMVGSRCVLEDDRGRLHPVERGPVLRTDRLLLRRWRDEDLVPFAALNADADVMEYLPAPLTRERSDALAASIDTHFEDVGFGLWAVEVCGRLPFIGFVGLNRVPFRHVLYRLAHPDRGALA